MSRHDFPISRRTLLRGAGAALALPWLEAMAPRAALASGTASAPVRMAFLFMPNGVHPKFWTPEGTGSDFSLSPTLEPLAEVRDQITVLTNLWHRNSNTGDGHYVKTSGFLTGTTINKTVGIAINCNGTSVDQLAAQRVGGATPAAVAGTRHRAGQFRRRHERRLHPRLRIPHCLAGTDAAARQGDQSATGLRATVPCRQGLGRCRPRRPSAARPGPR